MAIDPTWTVWCDVGNIGDARCHHWCYATGMTKQIAWNSAKILGWKRRDGQIICPGCAAVTACPGASRHSEDVYGAAL